MEPAWDLDDLEELDDARVLPALDRADFDGFAIGIPSFLIGPLTRSKQRIGATNDMRAVAAEDPVPSEMVILASQRGRE